MCAGVGDDRIYVDHGLAGDTLVVTQLDRLGRSPDDARDILDELTSRNVRLSLGGSIHDPTEHSGRRCRAFGDERVALATVVITTTWCSRLIPFGDLSPPCCLHASWEDFDGH
jgi:hypothetical protein